MRYDKYIAFLLSALIAGCADNTFETDTDPVAKAGEINISGEIEQRYLSRVDDGGFTDGDAIGLYIVDYKDYLPQQLNSQGNHATNVKFTYSEDENKWTGTTTLYWNYDTPVDAYSYYPFTDYIADVHSMSFAVRQRQDKQVDNTSMSAYEASDMLWAKVEKALPKSKISLNHKHIMSSVIVRLIEGDGFNGTWESLDKDILITNTSTETNIDLSTGCVTLDPDAQPSNITPYFSAGQWRAIVAPQTVTASTPLIAITVDGRGYKFSRNEDLTFEPGSIYKFTIKVEKPSTGDYTFSLIDESVTPWEVDDISHESATKIYTVVNVAEPGTLQSKLKEMGINPSSVINLKLTGTITQSDFEYIRDNFSSLKAINLKEVRTVDIQIYNDWPDGPYGYGIFEDNHRVSTEDRFDDATPTLMFWGMETLQHIIFPDHVKYLGYCGLARTSIVGTFELPEGVVWIGDGLLNNVHEFSTIHISKLILPSTVKYIGSGAFCNNEFTNELKLPDGIKYIGDEAFSECKNTYGEIHLTSEIEYIGERAFSATPITGTVVYPAGTKIINTAFGMTNIRSIYIPEGVEEISSWAFGPIDYNGRLANYDSELRGDLYLPNSIKKIGIGAFAGTKISHVHLPEQLEIVNKGVFSGCEYLMDTLKVPEGVIYIDKGAFEGCSNLSTIILPSTLEVIGGDHTEPDWLAGTNTFGGCYSLEELRCDAVIPPTLIGDPFSGLASQVNKDNFTLVVPEQSVELYQQAEYWREFKRISAYRNLVFRPQKAKVLNKGGSRHVVLNADAGKKWTVTYCPSWLHISALSGVGKCELDIDIDPMDHGSPDRTDEIRVKLEGTDYETAFKVSQYDYIYDEDQQFTLQTHTKGEGIPLVFIGDGYDAEDISTEKYLEDMQQSTEYFFDVEPYKTYKDYFDIYTAFAMSYESGVGSVNYLRNTKFDMTFGNGSYDSRIHADDSAAAWYAVDNTDVKETDMWKLTCVLVGNSNEYDGITYMYPNGLAVALCTKSTMPYPYDARGVLQHEAGGHAFGKLADEYIYHHDTNINSCPCVCCEHVDGLLSMQAMGWGYNLSLSGKSKDVFWQHMLHDNRVNDIVDIWEGGYFHGKGVYRSEFNSCMNNNVPYFSTWSRELIVQRIMRCAGMEFDYENFIANDSREWGQDFTIIGRASETQEAVERSHNAPVIVKDTLKRKNRKQK